MRIQRHSLLSPSLGTQREVVSFHYGPPNGVGKVYMQGSLHADELPGMLTLHHLRPLLQRAEDQGLLRGEVVLVPVANPIGLDQTLLYDHMGRFEAGSGENFNRRYPDFAPLIRDRLASRLGADPEENRRLIRDAMAEALLEVPPLTELESLRQVLVSLAYDADVVLDLHCDFEAVMHLYVETPYCAQAEPLMRYLGAQTVLLARGSGGHSFDEALSGVWWQLDEFFDGRFPIPLSCLSATVELRGKADVDHVNAAEDAARLFDFLVHRGIVAGDPPPLPPARCEPTPLAGSQTLRAPQAGVVVFLRQVGERIEVGDVVAEVIDPISGLATPVQSGVGGCLFARENRRYATRGMDLCKIAGSVPFRTGYLLSA
ncbi:M14 family metallopeptidase [Chitinimonas lacunae]|uniref:M14 family metallopeptidase n=1 Tax=Chitinimonas lacunae TaxID=1963018 RepID=A0ABV8MIQ6_9NEIS